MSIRVVGLLLGIFVAGVPVAAAAFGPAGHRIAGAVAEQFLCERAAAEVGRLSDGQSVAELGLWADRIRGQDAWAHTAPWHYMNIGDGESVSAYQHPSEGDVLWAIDHFAAVLGDREQSSVARAQALKFLVHFVVDIHQPLHVGRANDRGGNTIALQFNGGTVNLHRFWDTEALGLQHRSERLYADRLRRAARLLLRNGVVLLPARWAQESLALRADVYRFDRRSGGLASEYVSDAGRITADRLAQASARLAGLLNRLFCTPK